MAVRYAYKCFRDKKLQKFTVSHLFEVPETAPEAYRDDYSYHVEIFRTFATKEEAEIFRSFDARVAELQIMPKADYTALFDDLKARLQSITTIYNYGRMFEVNVDRFLTLGFRGYNISPYELARFERNVKAVEALKGFDRKITDANSPAKKIRYRNKFPKGVCGNKEIYKLGHAAIAKKRALQKQSSIE